MDTARPESDTARDFRNAVERLLADPESKTDDVLLVRRRLRSWSNNHAALRPAFADTAMMKEIEPLSQALSAAADCGLQALQAIESGRRLGPEWAARSLATLQAAAAPHAELELAVVPAIRRLVEAASEQPADVEKP